MIDIVCDIVINLSENKKHSFYEYNIIERILTLKILQKIIINLVNCFYFHHSALKFFIKRLFEEKDQENKMLNK